VLIGGGVLLGVGAMVIDVGRLYQNRAELQNGADAGALAVAKACVQDTASCTTANAQSIASGYASQNASQLTGDTAGTDLPCGYGGTGAGLSGCTGGTGALYNCPQNPSSKNYVDVNTHTQLPGSSTLLPPVFAELLLGKGGYSGSTVRACAQAEWGRAEQDSTALAFGISICQWDALTPGSTFSTPVVLFQHSSSAQQSQQCPGTPAGQTVDGGFGWMTCTPTATNDCSTPCAVSIDLTANPATSPSDPGLSVPTDCKSVIQQDVAAGTVVFIPVYDATIGSGKKATYELAGLAAFVITGYQNLPGLNPDVIPAGMAGTCTAAPPQPHPQCLFGHFTQALVPVSDVIGTGTDFGADAIRLTG